MIAHYVRPDDPILEQETRPEPEDLMSSGNAPSDSGDTSTLLLVPLPNECSTASDAAWRDGLARRMWHDYTAYLQERDRARRQADRNDSHCSQDHIREQESAQSMKLCDPVVECWEANPAKRKKKKDDGVKRKRSKKSSP